MMKVTSKVRSTRLLSWVPGAWRQCRKRWRLSISLTQPASGRIRSNDDGLPQLRINSQYRRMMENKETSKETRDYIKDRFRSAVDLLKNIEHRKQTIYRVCERIVERQREFLDHGVEHLKPMMLK